MKEEKEMNTSGEVGKPPLTNVSSPALPAPSNGSIQPDDELAEKALRAIREWQGNDEAIPDYETINTLADELESRQAYTRLIAALLPIAKAYIDDPGTSDLYDEQPVTIHLGDVRRAWSALRRAGVDYK